MSDVATSLNQLLAHSMNTDVAAIRLAQYSKIKAFDLIANQVAVLAAIKALVPDLSDDEVNAVFQQAVKFTKK